jgi:hypothetical protein
LFLCFPFISEDLEISFIKKSYSEIAKYLKLNYPRDFDEILKIEHRVEKQKLFWLDESCLQFIHPSYSESLPFALEDPKVKRIFSTVLSQLSEKDAADIVSWVVLCNFAHLPEEARNKLLLKLSENEKAAGDIAWVVAENFMNLPDDVRNILFKLSKKDEHVLDVARAVTRYFDNLPEELRNLPFNLSEQDVYAGDLAKAVAMNFSYLPEEVRNKLLLKLSEKESAVRSVAWVVLREFAHLSEDVRNLLYKLSEKDASVKYAVEAVALYYNNLPEDVRNLLFTDKIQIVLKELIQNLSDSDEQWEKDDAKKYLQFIKDEEFKNKMKKVLED